jgi:hypothetical protein
MFDSKFLSRRAALLMLAGSATLIAAPIALQIPAAMADDDHEGGGNGGSGGGNSGGNSSNDHDNEKDDEKDDNDSDGSSSSSSTDSPDSTDTNDDDNCAVGTNCNKE